MLNYIAWHHRNDPYASYKIMGVLTENNPKHYKPFGSITGKVSSNTSLKSRNSTGTPCMGSHVTLLGPQSTPMTFFSFNMFRGNNPNAIFQNPTTMPSGRKKEDTCYIFRYILFLFYTNLTFQIK